MEEVKLIIKSIQSHGTKIDKNIYAKLYYNNDDMIIRYCLDDGLNELKICKDTIYYKSSNTELVFNLKNSYNSTYNLANKSLPIKVNTNTLDIIYKDNKIDKIHVKYLIKIDTLDEYENSIEINILYKES